MSSTNAIIATNTHFEEEDEVTSKYTPLKMSAWESFKNFWVEHNNLRRYPFHPPGTPSKPAKESAWASFKGFFQTRHNFGRYPFGPSV